MLIHQRKVLPILLVLYLLLSYDGVQGEMRLSKLEELSLEKQLKLLNKPTVKTIKMKSTLSTMKQISSNSTIDISWTWLKTDSCPSGTVPIKKITKDNLIRQRRMPPPEDTNIIHAKQEDSGVEGTQTSACRLKIQKGQDSVQVGRRVDRTLYGDIKTRFFIHFQVGNKLCYNTLCPGFVVTNRWLILGRVFRDVAHRGGNTNWELIMSIDRDAKGNWWLLVGERMEVGFWPRKIFTALAKDFSENIEWGGSVYSPSNILFPQMGSGFLPKIPDHKFDAYWRALTFSNDKGKKINAENTPILLDSPSLFYVIDKPDWGHQQYPLYMFYGGPNQDKLM
ncbi:hypothetical protein P3L10_000373 [Capsicum annuum]|uniref:uncharacterized protein LOC124892959 n=1 Tax=Capsicum annuum TaxID=4072 RepID=UPI0007BED465|nr:uncharacterized protein LOC124892959 [Capsicum annuum]